MLKISSNLSLPTDAVTQTFAILAKRRAGKSFTARRFAEELLMAGQQIVVIDPKGDWWGIRSGADGKSPGFPVIILGGEHGDLPLEVNAPEVVAKLVIEERVNILLDLSDLRKSEVARFMGGHERKQGFLEAIYRLKAREEFRSPMMLTVDEADAIAPQKPFKGEERMLGAIEDIVRRGGQRGIGCMLVSQRSAVLNKNVLTQSQVLIAMRTIAPQDLDAMQAWIDVHGTPEQRKVLMESLPSLPTGDAWFWSPGWPGEKGIFQRGHVEPIRTFDSGATPEPGKKRVAPKNLADIDLGALERQMAATIEKAKADDPNELRGQITQLRKNIAELEKRPNAPHVDVQAEVKAAVTTALREQSVFYNQHLEKLGPVVSEAIARHLSAIGEFKAPEIKRAVAPQVIRTPPKTIAPPPVRSAAPRSGEEEKGLTPSHRKILTALAQYPEGMELNRLAALSGYTVNGHFNNMLGWLRTQDYVTPARVTPIQITQAGVNALGAFEPLPVGEELRDYWLSRVGQSKARILKTLFDFYPQGLSIEELATASGYTVNGHFNNMLGSLRTMGLITPPRMPIKAMDYLFET